jgi:transposase
MHAVSSIMPPEIPSREPSDLEEAKALIEALKGLVMNLYDEKETLKHRLQLLLRDRYGRRSEKFTPGQNLLDFPGLKEALAAAGIDAAELGGESGEDNADEREKHPGHGRRRLPEDMPREVIDYDLAEQDKTCNECGANLTIIGEETSEQLEYVPATFKVLRHRRLKYACKACECCVKLAERPDTPVLKGFAGPGLLANTLISKYDDHLPLNRQEEIIRRHGVELNRSTLCGWVRQTCELLQPLVDLMRERVLQSKVIQTDDTHVNFQLGERGRSDCGDLEGDTDAEANPASKSKRKLIKKGYCWVYLGDEANPYCVFDFTPDRTRAGPLRFLNHAPPEESRPGTPRPQAWRGYLQADAYSGYDEVFKGKDDAGKPLVVEVACWAHARRKFYDAQNSRDRVLARTALHAISELYVVERKLNELAKSRQERGREAPTYDQVARFRQRRARPVLDAIVSWMETHQPKVLPKSPLGEAISYARSNWTALNRYIEQGYLSIDNNASERALRNVVVGRKNWLFAGSENGGHWAASAYTLIESAKRCGANPWTWLRDVVARIATTRLSELPNLLPDNWLKQQS